MGARLLGVWCWDIGLQGVGVHQLGGCEESGDGGQPFVACPAAVFDSLRSAHRLGGPCGRGGAWGLLASYSTLYIAATRAPVVGRL